MGLETQVNVSMLSHESVDGDLASTFRVTSASSVFQLPNSTANLCVGFTATASTTSYVLNTLTLADDRGTFSMGTVHAAYIKNTSPSASIHLGGATFGASSAFPAGVNSVVAIPPGGFYCVGNSGSGFSGGGTFIHSGTTASTVSFSVVLVGESS